MTPSASANAPLPDAARYARDAAAAMDAMFEDLDQGGGYLFRISRGGRSVLSGAFGVCSYPVNAATPYTVARDKAHAKSVLKAAGVPVIPGRLFFAHRRRAGMRGPGREIADAVDYASQLGFPVFCKPNLGGRGNYAEIVTGADALRDYAQRVARDFESFLVEPVMRGAEHRVFVQDGAPVFWSRKAPAALIGDGVSALMQLLGSHNAKLEGSGLSATSVSSLSNLDLNAVPALGERILLAGRRNLSAAGGVEEISEAVPSHLADLAVRAAGAIGLRIAAIDLFDVSPTGDLSSLVIIEVNGNPGLHALELAGRGDLIQTIWTRMLAELLGA